MWNPFVKKTATNVLKLKIKGMHCVSCAMNIDGALEELPGVQSVTTNYAKGVTEITWQEKAPDLQKIKHVISELGYSVD